MKPNSIAWSGTLTRLIPLLALAVYVSACDGTPLNTRTETGEPPMMMPAIVEVESVPIIQPTDGNFVNAATTSGEATVFENNRVQPLASFSQTAVSRLATSQLDLVVRDRYGSAVIEVTNLSDIAVGGSESSLSFALHFVLLEEATYEIFGGQSGSYDGSPPQNVQFYESLQFNALNPWAVLFWESDNSLNVSPVDFTMNGVNEGNIGGNGPGEGSRTGVLPPGWYSFDGGTSIFSRGGGFSANGRTDLAIRLTSTTRTPQQQAAGIRADVEDLIDDGVLSEPESRGLIRKLDNAITKLDQGHVQSAISLLQDLIVQVNDFITAGKLSEAEGQTIIDEVQDLIVSLSTIRNRVTVDRDP
jgi:hypothetical protein